MSSARRADAIAGRAAHPMQPCVDLDEHGDVATQVLAHGTDALGDLDGIEAHAHLRAFEQLSKTAQLRLTDERERDQQILEPCVGHDLGFAELRDRDAGRPGLHLHPRDLGCLVGLRVRSEADARGTGHGSHLADVPFERVEVDHQRRRIQLVEVHAHRFGSPLGSPLGR